MVKSFKKKGHVPQSTAHVQVLSSSHFQFWREISVADIMFRDKKPSAARLWNTGSYISFLGYFLPAFGITMSILAPAAISLATLSSRARSSWWMAQSCHHVLVFFWLEHEYSTALTGQMIIYSFIADGWSTWIWKNKHGTCTIVSNSVCV